MGLKRPKRGIRRPILKVENHRFAIRGFAIRKLETGLKKIEERGEPLWRRRCKLRSTGCGAISGEGNEERERSWRWREGVVGKGRTKLRLGVSRRNLQKYIGAQEGGSNRASFSAAPDLYVIVGRFHGI